MEADAVRPSRTSCWTPRDALWHHVAHEQKGYVYILASQKNGTLYIGVTSDLAGRVLQHRSGTGSKFAARHGVKRLVWFDECDLVADAIAREKAIKKWPRAWKSKLIEENNPHWHDLTWRLL